MSEASCEFSCTHLVGDKSDNHRPIYLFLIVSSIFSLFILNFLAFLLALHHHISIYLTPPLSSFFSHQQLTVKQVIRRKFLCTGFLDSPSLQQSAGRHNYKCELVSQPAVVLGGTGRLPNDNTFWKKQILPSSTALTVPLDFSPNLFLSRTSGSEISFDCRAYEYKTNGLTVFVFFSFTHFSLSFSFHPPFYHSLLHYFSASLSSSRFLIFLPLHFGL
jgi:hypothetical protein